MTDVRPPEPVGPRWHGADRPVAGLLLTGGASRRMGCDKARLLVDGHPLAERLAGLLTGVATPVVEVGPGVTGLAAAREELPGSGPLAAVAAGWEALCGAGAPRAALVLACDLPLVSEKALRLLAAWPGDASVVPVVDGRPQPLCARWSATALARARAQLARDPSLRPFCAAADTVLVDVEVWGRGVEAREFHDVDCPGDLDELGLKWQPGPAGPNLGVVR